MVAIAFFLSFATAIIHLLSQLTSWRHMDSMYPVLHMESSEIGVEKELLLPNTTELGAMTESGINKIMPMPEPDIWRADDALDVEQRLYATSSYSQLVVKDVSAYTERVRGAILAKGGRVLSSSIEKFGRYKVGNISARVPSEYVTDVLSTIKEGVVVVVSERTTIDDQTGQYVSIADKILAIQDEVMTIEEQLLDESLTNIEKRRLELQLQRLQSRITSLQNSQDAVEDEVQYAKIVVSVSDGVRFFDPSARPSTWEMFERAGGVLQTLLYFIWNATLLTLLYMLVWFPVTYAVSFAASYLVKK